MSTPSGRSSAPAPGGVLLALLLAAALVPGGAAASHSGPRTCTYCLMPIDDPGFGGEVRLRSGKVRVYDSIECMAAAVLTDSVPRAQIRAITVTDHDAPHAQLPVGHATFVHCPRIHSPMGQDLLAVRGRAGAQATCPAPEGAVLDWRGVLTRVNAVWFQGKLSVQDHAGAGVKTSPRR
jgi:hypothetical protein